MVSTGVLGFVGLGWGVFGMIAILFPEWLLRVLALSLDDPWRRFWVTQTLLLSGLILIIVTLMLEWFWLWIGCGVIMVIKAGFFLGSSDMGRRQLFDYVNRWPSWVIRGGGMVNVSLTVLLAADVILHG